MFQVVNKSDHNNIIQTDVDTYHIAPRKVQYIEGTEIISKADCIIIVKDFNSLVKPAPMLASGNKVLKKQSGSGSID
jgi:hypothetical protein